MVINRQPSLRRRQAAVLMTDLVVAMSFICLAAIPLATSFTQERRILLTSYQRAVVLEIVDGEMELLVAGEWRRYANGIHQLTPVATAATNLPPGKLQLTVKDKHLVLEWLPEQSQRSLIVRREITLP
jgi:hypothetical protein